MPDLKDLLRPLDDEPMPDRWDRIRRRPIEPLEDRGRPRRAVALGTAAVAALLVLAVIVTLGPLRGGTPPTVGQPGTNEPPTWLVDAAYHEAYESGDLIPDSARWTLLPRSAIPTPVGPAGAGDPTENYVIVLRGNFTGSSFSSPIGASVPKGSVLSIAYDADTHQIADLSLGDQDVDLAGLQPFTLPGPDDRYTSPQGWSVAVAPGWRTMPLADGWSDVAGPGAVISNHDPEVPVARDGSFPQADSEGFPARGVTLVVAKMNGVIPGSFNPKEPPLSYDDFAKGSALGGASTLDGLVFGGPDGEYTATVRTGPDASPLDLAAIRDVVASLSFTDSGVTSSAQSSDTPSHVEVVLPTPPECGGGVPTSDHLKLATENGSHMALIQECAYGPANTRFTITFTNQIVTIDGKDGPPQNLSIYRSQEDAISILPSGDEFAIDQNKAVFVGAEVTAPGTITYEVQPLPAGTYYVQSDSAADKLVATLVVE